MSKTKSQYIQLVRIGMYSFIKQFLNHFECARDTKINKTSFLPRRNSQSSEGNRNISNSGTLLHIIGEVLNTY